VARRRAAAIDAALSSIDDAELIALTRDLVRIPSVFRPGDSTATEAEVARYIERWLGKQGFSVEVHEVAPGRPNVVAWLGDRDGGPSLLLEGHTTSSPRAIRASGRTRRSAPSWSTVGSTGAGPPT